MYGMCNVNACVFADSVILRVLKNFQDLGWIATCIPKNDIHDPSAGGVISIRPPGEPPITNTPEPMGTIENDEYGEEDDGLSEQSL